jgi:hypothetical protein
MQIRGDDFSVKLNDQTNRPGDCKRRSVSHLNDLCDLAAPVAEELLDSQIQAARRCHAVTTLVSTAMRNVNETLAREWPQGQTPQWSRLYGAHTKLERVEGRASFRQRQTRCNFILSHRN